MWTGSLSVTGRDGLIEGVAKEDLEIIHTHIGELWDNLVAKRDEFLKEYSLAQRCAWEPPQQGRSKWKWHTALERRRERS